MVGLASSAVDDLRLRWDA